MCDSRPDKVADGHKSSPKPDRLQTPRLVKDVPQLGDCQTIPTPPGQDNGLHAMIASLQAQMSHVGVPTLPELQQVARALGLSHPYSPEDLDAILRYWGRERGLNLHLAVKSG